MKKIYLALSFLAASFASMAQCTPDPSINKPGIMPTRLPDGIVGSPYSEVVSLMVPLDTTFKYQGTDYDVTVDSATVIYISDLPFNFSYTTDKPSRTWNGGQKGCALLEGNPKADDIGNYVVYVKVRTFFKIKGLPTQFDQIDSSSIDFKIVMPNALQENAQIAGIKVYPNPAKDQLHLVLNKFSLDAKFELYDITGKVYSSNPVFDSNTGEAIFDISDLQSGVYFVKGFNQGRTYQARFIKQ
ncbi:MAG: T9SS type A sorting domain-containing protein [Bacteroidia bacterium]|nr:T9SS type A sorting domain-containing protein [Bacteroidia bacterium]MCF8427540.1 T9SS type A sorting domain-containing protein [Bacteroidia bacterium]